MTAPSSTSTYRLTAAERETLRNLYSSGLHTQAELAQEYGRSRETIRQTVMGIVRPTITLSAGIRSYGPPRPVNQPSLPTVRLSQRRRIGGNSWWPGLPRNCQHAQCGGRLLVRSPDSDEGDISCSLCARTVARVGSELP